MNSKRGSSICILLLILLIVTFLPNTVMAQETVTGTQDDTTGVWLFNAGTTVPAGAPTDNIIERAVFYDILDYIGNSLEEVYAFGHGSSEPTPGQEDKTKAEIVQGLSAIDDFGYLDNAGDDAANFDTGRGGYFLGGFDPDDSYVIVSDGTTATGVLGPSGATDAVKAEAAINGYEIFIFEDAELSGMIVTLSNGLGLSISFSVEDLQVNTPTRNGADDTLIAIDLDKLTEFDGTFIDTIRIEDDSVASSSTFGDTTLEIDAIAIRESVKKRLTSRLLLDKFDDINGNGIYDADDVKIVDWRVGVMDPHGVTTTYLTPTILEITEFGVYTVTEDLFGDWEQTALRVDGVYVSPTVEVTVLINEDETHDVLYGNKLRVPPPPAKLIIEKFNDTNGNGVFEGGVDVMLDGWEIDVTDPGAVTTTHLTPISLGITNFGTYTITEDLPTGWEQTALRVDGVYITPTVSTMLGISEGETHDVLYGNKEIPPPPPAELILDKFNDTNGNGVYDVGVDLMIAGWQIDVTDPDGITISYFTPRVVDITKFGTYTITEDLPADWEQTALRVDGVYMAPTVTYHISIDEGETHSILYGNKLRPPPPQPPRIGIGLSIYPILVYTPVPVTFGWFFDSPPEVTPKYAELYLRDPDGVIIPLYTYTPPPWADSYVWASTAPKGMWTVYVVYHYAYLGRDYTAGASGGFIVRAAHNIWKR